MELSYGKIRADAAHEKLQVMGYAGSERDPESGDGQGPPHAARSLSPGAGGLLHLSALSWLYPKVIRNGNFTSTEDLIAKLLAFISDYDQKAKPFAWTYSADPLKVA